MIAMTGYNGFVGIQLISSLPIDNCILLGRESSHKGQKVTLNLEATNGSDLIEPLKQVKVLIHLAARVHVMDDLSNNPLLEFRSVNTQGTLNLARQAAQAGVKRFIFLSSIKVNGESTSNRCMFSAYDERLPEDPYAISKSEAEELLLALGKETGMEIVIIRPPLVYGEGVKANFASLMKLVGKGFPVPFRRFKNNKRSLVSVYNLIDLIKVCMDHPKAANEVFLVSDDDDLSTAEIVALMAKVQNIKNLALPIPIWCFKLAGKVLNKNSEIDRLTGSLQIDISHTKETLNWQPPYSVEHGFKKAAQAMLLE